MKAFLDDNFLLQNKSAEYLYHEHAKKMPIIDYHNHLNPESIALDINFKNITEVWLQGDHYKWRAMRTNGISEKYITGNASAWEKFEKWAETVPYTLRNPLYHWTHLELKRYFDIDILLSQSTARKIFDQVNLKLASPLYSVVGLLEKQRVETLCTTDDPIDSLVCHKKIALNNSTIQTLPTWRPDKVMAVENLKSFNNYLDTLAEVSNVEIIYFSDLIKALEKRQDYFETLGCRLSDHGLENFYADDYSQNEIEAIFDKIRSKISLSAKEISKYKSAMLYELGVMNHRKRWTQQFHIGPLRNNNSRFFKSIGADTGFDSMGDALIAKPMSRYLNRLDSNNQLTKTILYNLNPSDNALIGSMIGNFQDGTIPGKIQFGSAWWFLDQKDGMEKQINSLSNLGLLSRFVGMLTDSRSFLSFPRHEYFRRILCNLLGTDIENGEIPNDKALVGKIVEDICYNNAKQYFNFDEE